MNNLCKNCEVKNVCKINEFMKTNSDVVDILLNKCSIRESLSSDTSTEVCSSLLPPTPVKEYQNFNNASSKQRTEVKKRKAVVSLVKECDVELDYITSCSSCGGTTDKSDLIPCAKCGVETCSNCRTYVAETHQKLCDKCWSEE